MRLPFPLATALTVIVVLSGLEPALTKAAASEPQPVYLNQSGFDIERPKRFTVPGVPDGAPFQVRRESDQAVVYQGKVENQIGDFSDFRPPQTAEQYIVEVADRQSVPFGIGHFWNERVTYQPAVDFMIESRHYVGNWSKPCAASFGWRDDCHFGFEVPTLVAQYISNPTAYDRMPKKVKYIAPTRSGLWGTLAPYNEDAPDIVKLIHWGVDVIVTQDIRHVLAKEQLAAFLYSYPMYRQYIPESTYRDVLKYAIDVWEKPDAPRKYRYDETPATAHNLLALDTHIGTTKGGHPPAHSIMPNLYMYEVSKREGLPNSERFFQAAYDQAQWSVETLNWSDPLVTKGQRQSEFVTICGMVMFQKTYPDRAPEGLVQKLEQWAKTALERSDNMWDFRKFSARQWVPTGPRPQMWNEPGNVAGFPACALSVKQVIGDPELRDGLERLAVSHLDNMAGRNPTGRHFSHRAPSEIEGVEFGWYSSHPSGIGRLQKVTFVLDGAPKNEHFPYHPEIGNVGWTEGWVNFNTAYNMSLAIMATEQASLEILDATFTQPVAEAKVGEKIGIRLTAPLNFDYEAVECADLRLRHLSGDERSIRLSEAGLNSRHFQAVFTLILDADSDDALTVEPGEFLEFTYGYGWLGKQTALGIRD